MHRDEQLERFIRDSRALTGQIRAMSASLSPDPERIAVIVRHTHSLKSLAAQNGVPGLENLIHRLEGEILRGRTGDIDRIRVDELVLGIEDALLESESCNGEKFGDSGIGQTTEHTRPAPRDTGNPSDDPVASNVQASGGAGGFEAAGSSNPPCVPDFFPVLNGMPEDRRNRLFRYLAQEYKLFILTFQGNSRENDSLALRFEQMRTRIEQNLAVIEYSVSAGFLQVAVITRGEISQEHTVPGVHLVHIGCLDFQEFLFLETCGLLGIETGSGIGTEGLFPADRIGGMEFTKNVAKAAGKRTEFSCCGFLPWDGNILDTVRGIVLQAVRNAVSHGLETAAERVECGKKPIGSIVLACTVFPETVRIIVEDDGRGIDVAKLSGLRALPVDDSESVGERNAVRPIDAEAISKEFAAVRSPLEGSADGEIGRNDYSGRGIGIEMMRYQSEKLLSGKFGIESREGFGTRLSFVLPRFLEELRGLAGEWKTTKLFFPAACIRGFVPRIGDLHPSRIGVFWYIEYRYTNIQISEAHGGAGLMLEPIEFWDPAMEDLPCVVVHTGGVLKAVLLSEAAGTETAARGVGSDTLFSQALQAPAWIFGG